MPLLVNVVVLIVTIEFTNMLDFAFSGLNLGVLCDDSPRFSILTCIAVHLRAVPLVLMIDIRTRPPDRVFVTLPSHCWAKVPDFLARTGADILAVTVGNVHGRYAKADPRLDLARLGRVKAAAACASDSPLVSSTTDKSMDPWRETLLAIHGASGLPDSQVQASISLGVCKFNVNTEVRAAAVGYLLGLGRASASEADGKRADAKVDLLEMLDDSVGRMTKVIEQKMLEFDPKR